MMETMRELAEQIRAGDKMVEDGQLIAAKAAAEAKGRFEAGETDGCNSWKQWVQKHVRLTLRRVDELAAIGRAENPGAAIAKTREKKRDSMQKTRLEPRGSTTKTGDAPNPGKSRLRLNLPDRVDSRGMQNTDHVEREYTNLMTVWNNSSHPARSRFLAALGFNISVAA